MKRVALEPVMILHTWPFKETSCIVELLSKKHGRVAGLIRGARSQRSKVKHYIQLFLPLTASWSGRSELVSISQLEPTRGPYELTGDRLICGLYLNELLYKVLRKYQAENSLFDHYQLALSQLQAADNVAATLRCFEKQLLVSLGFGYEWDKCFDTGDKIKADHYYGFDPEHGIVSAGQSPELRQYKGEHLLALYHEQIASKEQLQTAKKVLRAALHRVLGGASIRSRELFV